MPKRLRDRAKKPSRLFVMKFIGSHKANFAKSPEVC